MHIARLVINRIYDRNNLRAREENICLRHPISDIDGDARHDASLPLARSNCFRGPGWILESILAITSANGTGTSQIRRSLAMQNASGQIIKVSDF
jgi:hypothetical protein